MIVLHGDRSIMCEAEYKEQPSMDDAVIFKINSRTKLTSTRDNLD